jgi:peptide subunit release factor 1 (eRF1)
MFRKSDLIEGLTDSVEKTVASVKLISNETEERDYLYSAFSGIAGILRFPLDLSY